MSVSAPIRPTQRRSTVRWIRLLCVATVAMSLFLIGLRVILSPGFFVMPGSIGYLLEPIILLLAYAAVGIALTARAPAQMPLSIGTVIGILAGVLWIINHTIEMFISLPSQAAPLISGPFFLGAFLLWGAAGFLAARTSRSFGYGLIAALWSAMLTVLLTDAYGFLLMHVALPHLAQIEASDPDFLRSHWDNVTLFAIANTLDAGFSHLLEAPFIAAIFGAIGSLIGRLSAPEQRTQ
jgi:hypothetical protein